MNGINLNELYRVSRNPMYVAYFIYFLGCVFLTRSWILLALLISFQISAHWFILSEERWCIREFGEEYIKYMNKVRRYNIFNYYVENSYAAYFENRLPMSFLVNFLKWPKAIQHM